MSNDTPVEGEGRELPAPEPEVIEAEPRESSIIAASAHFEGPLPPPALLSQYNVAVPDGAERVIKMAERSQEHRQNMEALMIPAKISLEMRGQIFGMAIAMTVILIGAVLIWAGKDWQGFAVIIGDLVALIGIFVYTDKRKREELAGKRDEEPFKQE